MKNVKLNYFLLVVSLSWSYAFGQLFVPDSSTWHTYYVWIGTNGPGLQYTSHNNIFSQITGDTIVGTDTLQTVSTERVLGEPNPTTINYYGYLFNDSNIVYYGEDTDSMEILYDFNLNPGDSVIMKVGYGIHWGIDTVKVLSVDTITLNGLDRKRINFEAFSYYCVQIGNYVFSDPGMIWVEGVGDVVYGLDLSGNGYNFIADWTLVCFTEGLVETYGDCNLGLAGNEFMDAALYPNPASDMLNVTLSHALSGSLSMYDSNGKLVLSNVLFSGKNQLSLENLEPGLYYAVISSEQGNFAKKVVKY